jgi:hypothetical protein
MALLEANWRPSANELRVFALGVGALVAGLAWIYRLPTWPTWALSAAAFAACSAGLPLLAWPFYWLLLVVTLPVRWLLSPLLLALLYFGVLTPIALLLRITGRDALGRIDRSTASYWVERDSQPDLASYFRRY